MQADCLVIGCSSSGKSLLVKQLMNVVAGSENKKEVPVDTAPTVGVEIDTLTINDRNYVVREVGAPMMMMWKSYYTNSATVMFVIDISATHQLPLASMELFGCLTHRDLQNKPMMIVLNKIDMPHVLNPDEVVSMLRLQELIDKRRAHQSIKLIKTSAVSCENIGSILNWLIDCKK